MKGWMGENLEARDRTNWRLHLQYRHMAATLAAGKLPMSLFAGAWACTEFSHWCWPGVISGALNLILQPHEA
jgi:hypothetical protein